MKSKIIIVMFLVLLIIISYYGINQCHLEEKNNVKAEFPLVNEPTNEAILEGEQEAIGLVKSVYDVKEGHNSLEVEYPTVINDQPCYTVYVSANNELTTTTMEIFGVDIEHNIIYLLNRVSGEYELYAEIKFKDKIDKNLEIIMSSPKEASNIGAYIKAHQVEYDAILALGYEALPYLKSIWDSGDHGLRGALALSLCEDSNYDLNIVSSNSPDSIFYIETYGVNTNITAGGIFPASGIRLIDNQTGDELWGMTPGYYGTQFLWSSDSRYVAIYNVARIYGETILLDTIEMNVIAIPGIADIKEKSEIELTENSNRPDPYFTATQWLSNTTIQVGFRWTGENDIYYSGTYVFDVITKEMSELKFSE